MATITQTELRRYLPWETRLLMRCQALAAAGRLRFIGDGCISYRRKELRGRVGSRFFRIAVEAITRHESRLVALKETRRGKPYDVRLSCFNCEADRAKWSWREAPEPTHFLLESWPFEGDRTRAYGHCSGCWQAVSLIRDPLGRWSARISRKPTEY